jgi:hypothetical protein
MLTSAVMFLLMMFSVVTIYLGGGVVSADFDADSGITGFVDGAFGGAEGCVDEVWVYVFAGPLTVLGSDFEGT